MYANRYFYLPDNRPFVSTLEYSGFLEKWKTFSDPKPLGTYLTNSHLKGRSKNRG
jgi:hypothetical protein